MTKQLHRNRFMITVAIICPILFFPGCQGLFFAEGGLTSLWAVLGAALAPICVFMAGPVGFGSALYVFLTNRKDLKHKKLLGIGILLLLLVNFCTILPIYYLISRLF